MDMPEPQIPILDMHPKEVVFSWDDPETGKHFHWATERLERYLIESSHEVILVAIDIAYAATMPEERGLERYRLERIPDDPATWTPIIVLHMPDDTGLIVDGNHRYFKAAMMGEQDIRAFFVQQDIWSKYLVDIPHYEGSSVTGWSGIL